MDPAIARIAQDNLETSASIVYPEYEYDATEDSDYQYEQVEEQDPELVQKPSQTIATIVPAPSNLKTAPTSLQAVHKWLGHEHFWTSGTDQAEEGKFFWMSTG